MSEEAADAGCTFVSGNTPCPTCPRKISALHMCKLLQDEVEACERLAGAQEENMPRKYAHAAQQGTVQCAQTKE